jgi:site-specific DNA-methyltransferase (adenine-specific)
MWLELSRIVKNNGAICLFGSEPFSSNLRVSNISDFKYDWVWQKSNPANIALANKMPLKYHELISVFYKKQVLYNKQMIPRDEKGIARIKAGKKSGKSFKFSSSEIQTSTSKKVEYSPDRYDTNFKNPSSVLNFKVERGKKHPTQKPVALLEYLIKTYTVEGETVLDFTMGSGSTGVAAKNLKRKFIGIEKEEKYFKIAEGRIND